MKKFILLAVLVLFCFQNVFAEKKSIILDDGYILFDDEDFNVTYDPKNTLSYLYVEFENYMLNDGWKLNYTWTAKPQSWRLNGFIDGSLAFLAAKRSLVYGAVYAVRETEDEAKVWIFCNARPNKTKSGETYVWGVILDYCK